jgi:glycosyltransferase involved in cell wall biosynthesis
MTEERVESGRNYLEAREILFVTASLHIGGTERHLAAIAPALVKLGWQVSVYSLTGGGALREEMEQNGVKVFVPPPRLSTLPHLPQFILAGADLLKVMRRRRPAVVHFFLPAAYLVGASLAFFSDIPVRIMSRRSLNVYQRRYPLALWFERRLHRKMTAILGNSKSVVRELHEMEDVPAGRLGLIYNGVDVSRFADAGLQQATRGELGLGSHTLALVMVGNLIPYKGHGDLISALGLAAAQFPEDWRLLLVGHDFGVAAELREQAVRLGIDRNILFLGLRNDVPDILSACDIGVLCSHQEGFSNAILEMMAAGLPMIVTDVGGNAEAVLDGTTGIVVPPRDPDRLAAAIVRLAQDPSLRERFGRAGRCRVAEHFALERSIEAYDVLYRALLAGDSPQDIRQIGVTGWITAAGEHPSHKHRGER